jgi:hypothetical protein
MLDLTVMRVVYCMEVREIHDETLKAKGFPCGETAYPPAMLLACTSGVGVDDEDGTR